MTQILSKQLVERVLQRFGLSTFPENNIDGLRAVYSSWCKSIPFDNSRKLICLQENTGNNPLPGAGAAEFFEFWLKHGTGGTCWSGNGALQCLLETLGFRAERGLATMLVVPGLPPNHGTVAVTIDERQFLVDASILHIEPLPISSDKLELATTPLPFGVKPFIRDGQYHIWWRPLHLLNGLECRVDHIGLTLDDFQTRYGQTREWSPFNYQLAMRKVSGEKTIGVGGGLWVELAADGSFNEVRLDEVDRKTLLIEKMGLSEEIVDALPQDRPTPPPPWSETARKSGAAATN